MGKLTVNQRVCLSWGGLLTKKVNQQSTGRGLGCLSPYSYF